MSLNNLVTNLAQSELKRLQKDTLLINEEMINHMLKYIPDDVSQESLAYNVSFWVQALLKKPTTLLRYDKPEQILYPVEKRPIPLTSYTSINYITQFLPPGILLQYFVKNLPELVSQIQELLFEIEKSLESKNVVILSNHTSWLNLPLIATLLQTVTRISKQNIYTLLGPAITTQELAYSGITNFSNLIKTVPDTINGNIESPDLIKSIKKNMFGTINSVYIKKNSIGNILLIAPSGTTDEYVRGDNEHEFLLKKPSTGTERFVSILAGNKNNIFSIIGSNDRHLMSGNTTPRRGEVYMRESGLVSGDRALSLLNSLPNYVVNSYGKQIGSWK